MHTPDIMFSALVDNYMRDMIDNKKIAVTTAARKQRAFNKMITPFFNQKPINTIDELDVLNWQQPYRNKAMIYILAKDTPQPILNHLIMSLMQL